MNTKFRKAAALTITMLMLIQSSACSGYGSLLSVPGAAGANKSEQTETTESETSATDIEGNIVPPEENKYNEGIDSSLAVLLNRAQPIWTTKSDNKTIIETVFLIIKELRFILHLDKFKCSAFLLYRLTLSSSFTCIKTCAQKAICSVSKDFLRANSQILVNIFTNFNSNNIYLIYFLHGNNICIYRKDKISPGGL